MKYDIAQLIEEKEFSELTNDERSFVLSQVEESEYSFRRNIILNSKELLKNDLRKLKPNDSIKVAALQSLRAKKSNRKIIPLFIGYKVPAWLAAASILLAFLLNSILNFSFNKTALPVNQLSQIDTVFVEKKIIDTVKIKEQPDTVIKVVYVPQNTDQQPITEAQHTNDAELKTLESTQMNNYNPVIDLSTDKKHKGKSLNEDELAQSVLGI